MLSDGTILLQMQKGAIKINPEPKRSALQPASIDLTLGTKFQRQMPTRWVPYETSLPLSLVPGARMLADTQEWIEIADNIVARVEGKSSLGRQFIMVHSTAGFIDPGWKGTITLELANIGHQTIMLNPGDPICQISFDWLDNSAIRPYGSEGLNSHYLGQSGPTLAHQ